MTVLRAYRFAVWLPIALPALAWLTLSLGLRPGPVVNLLAGSGIVSVPVSLLLLAMAWPRMKRMTAGQLERLLWLLPIVAVPIVYVGALIWVWNEPSLASGVGYGGIFLWATGFTLAFGYGYVLLIRIVGRIVRVLNREAEPGNSLTSA
jgi:hypothetical protein